MFNRDVIHSIAVGRVFIPLQWSAALQIVIYSSKDVLRKINRTETALLSDRAKIAHDLALITSLEILDSMIHIVNLLYKNMIRLPQA
jgi:hypothetical protein